MTDLPIDLADCETDAQRARWLLCCPPERLILYDRAIRLWLNLARFEDGLSYLDTILLILRDTRRDDGNFSNSMNFAVANGRLRRVAEQLEAR